MNTHLFSGTSASPACFSVLQLAAIKGLGLKSFHHLYQHFGSSSAILSAPLEQLIASGVKPRLAYAIEAQRSVDDLSLAREHALLLEWLEQKDQHLVCLEDQVYPSGLLEIFCPPPLLYIKGNLAAFQPVSLAIVGSRRPTLAGQRHARRFAQALAERDIVVSSGLAIGIDTFAHQGALAVDGLSCAVLGSGLDCIYPKQNQQLAQALCERGALVSEMALGMQALPANFPRRNRIISGLSKGVLVVEAGLKSGSLITAEFALEQNREVFAIPGPIDSPLARGCHALIKQGAVLVDEVDDIVHALAAQHGGAPLAIGAKEFAGAKVSTADLAPLEADEQMLVNLIGHQTVSFDDLMHRLNMDVSALTNVLMSLELKGILNSSPGGYQRT